MLSSGRKMVGSTIFRFFVLFFLAQMGLALGALYFVQRSSEQALLSEQQTLVRDVQNDLVTVYGLNGRAGLATMIRTQLHDELSDEAVILLIDEKGQPVSGNLAVWPADIPLTADWHVAYLNRVGAGQPETMGLSATRLARGEHLLIGAPLAKVERLTLIGREATLGAVSLAIPLTLALSLLLGRMITVRIRCIVETARLVGDGDLHQRVPLDHSGDAFDDLGQSVNAMLDRIEALVRELRVVTDGLAHDLRSPITRLRSVLERSVIETRDAAAQMALSKVAMEADNLLGMLTLALQISRAEAGIGRDRFVTTDVGALLSDLVEIYGPVAEDAGKTLSCDDAPGLSFALHRELVSQALGNLIENALKYADGGQTIRISAEFRDGGLTLGVADDGPGIPEPLRGEARKRFSRLDPARSKPGSGLGLSLVEAVAKLHRGQMSLEDNAPGLKVVMRLVM